MHNPAARLPRHGRKARIGIIDLLAKRPIDTAYTRLMYPNFASIMPQVVGVWAEELGHEVHYLTYTGREDLWRDIPAEIDVLFVSAFTQAAYLAYAISALFRARGVVTVLGGPHARSYPDDAAQHFDYVVGVADRALIADLLADCSRQHGQGVTLSVSRPPRSLPGARERWKFIEHNIRKAPYGAAVPMLGSLGCPYTCSFCVDASVDYQPLSYDQLRADLTFLRQVLPRPIIGWHDPNFAVRFADYMRVIDEAGPPGSFRFVAESSLSLLSEPHLQALQRHGFIGLIVGIESWFGFGDKAGQKRRVGGDKVAAVADHVNRIARYIPYVQTNFVWGLDEDDGDVPFELNKRFVDLAPAAFPSHSVFTAYGEAAPLGVQVRREARVLDVPYFFLDTASIHNVQLKHHSPAEFYDRLSDVVRYSYSPRATWRRLQHNRHSLRGLPRWMNVIRSLTSYSRHRYYATLGDHFASNREFRAFAAREGAAPGFFRDPIRPAMGRFYDYLTPSVRAYLDASASPTSASAAQ